jgi:hypothetical protein
MPTMASAMSHNTVMLAVIARTVKTFMDQQMTVVDAVMWVHF